MFEKFDQKDEKRRLEVKGFRRILEEIEKPLEEFEKRLEKQKKYSNRRLLKEE